MVRKTFHGYVDLLQTKENRHLATNMHDAETFPPIHYLLITIPFFMRCNVKALGILFRKRLREVLLYYC